VVTGFPSLGFGDVANIFRSFCAMAFNMRHFPIMFFILTAHCDRDTMLKLPRFTYLYFSTT
jgi:hypothetical protein